MGTTYTLPRGTTWPITILVTQGGKPVSLLGYRVVCTVRSAIVNGTTDTGALAPIWQGDSATSGVSIAIPGTTLVWSPGASVTTSSYNVPEGAEANGYFYSCSDAGSGATAASASEWPTPPPGVMAGQPGFDVSSAPDANGVVWTCAGLINMASGLMPASATQVLPNPPAGSGVPLFYDVVVDDGSNDIFQTEAGNIRMVSRITLSQP